MLTGIEASTLPGCQVGGLAALLANMQAGESASPSLQERVAAAEAFLASLPATPAAAAAAAAEPPNGAPNSSSSSSSSSSSRAGPLLRGPALAAVELAKRKLLLGLGQQQQLAEALLHYHERLGHVVSCAMDVRSYLPLLTGDSRTMLSRQLQLHAEQAAEELQQQQGVGKQQLDLLRRQMAARQIHADLGGPAFDSPQAAAQHAQQLMALYAAALPHYEGLDERERGPADELLWLAAAALVKAAALESRQQQQQQQQQQGVASGVGYLLQALLVQEAAAKGRPYCAPVRLGLTALHGLVGNARAAAQHFGALDVKHIQHDTLSGQHLLPLQLGLAAADAAEGLLRVSLALFEDHLRDAGDTLMQAFRTGTHTKVLEFVCFKERLERSHSFVLARAEQQLLAISKAAAAAGPEQAAAAAVAAAAALPLSLLGSCDWRGALLPGHALSLGALLVQESCLWLLVCLEAWSKAVKHARSKKKAKKQTAAGSTAATAQQPSDQTQEDQAAEVLQELASVQAALVSCLDGLVSSTSRLLAVPVSDGEANLLSEFDPSSNAGLQALVGWETRLSLQPVLVDMVKAQRQVLQQIYNKAAAMTKRAGHISWAAVAAKPVDVPVKSADGASVGSEQLSLRVAPTDTAKGLVHRYLVYVQQNARRGTASTLTRSEVRGGGKKPYKQKGTGGARRGSSTSPLFPGGGISFGPKPKDWSIKMNKKERRLALATALQSAAADVVVVDSIADAVQDGKTKSLVSTLGKVGAAADKKTLLVLAAADEAVMRAGRNVAKLAINTADAIQVFDVLNADTIVLEKAALEAVKAAYAPAAEAAAQ
ncbi:hypothetical protein OEZ86_000751 [Tetradesmus obliquus]|nr:hypothetical protein OEZ86_000751 [Tetradesmus obliquus]